MTAPQLSVLTDRDLQLVEAGYWPIDCDPARRLNEAEIADARASREKMGRQWPDPNVFIPCVHRGVLMFQRRTELLGTIDSEPESFCDVGPDVPSGGTV